MQHAHVLWMLMEWGMGRNSALLNDNSLKITSCFDIIIIFFFWLGGYVKVSLTCVADMDNIFN